MNDAFRGLVHRYVDGQATAEDVRLLNERLRDDEKARAWFIELLNIDAALTEALFDAVDDEDEVGTTVAAQPRRRRVAPAVWALAAAACLAIVAGSALWWQASTQPLATVHGRAGVDELADGADLYSDWHAIRAGSVALVTARGARVVIEAPARFRFETAGRLHLERGRLSADVPPAAVGFTVVTPSGEAVDLGTQFGVDVPLEKPTEIHVFEGDVIAQTSAGTRQRNLTKGDALLLASPTRSERSLRSAAFIRSEEVASLHAALLAGQRESSRAAVDRLRDDPALVAVFDFAEPEAMPAGTYRVVQGRWPGSRAAEFVSVGDHMRLDVGGAGQWPRLTLAAWVRLDRLGEPYQSLLHTDGWGQNPGQVHWMVTRHTTMRLALYGNTLAAGSDEPDGYPDSRTSVLPEQGRWVHLATVYDSTDGTVRFYLNGEFDNESRQEMAHPARLGPAQIGNWDQQDRKLSGRIDELVILSRAASDAEVRALFEAGNPYR